MKGILNKIEVSINKTSKSWCKKSKKKRKKKIEKKENSSENFGGVWKLNSTKNLLLDSNNSKSPSNDLDRNETSWENIEYKSVGGVFVSFGKIKKVIEKSYWISDTSLILLTKQIIDDFWFR